MKTIRVIMAGIGMLAGICVVGSALPDSLAHAAPWSFVDGGAISANNAAFPQLPVTTVHNGALYVAWYESLSSPPGIRIRKFDGTSWSNAGSSGATLVEGTTVYQVQPALASYNGSLYAAYVDFDSVWGNSRIHVKKFNGTAWSDANNNNYNIVLDPIGSCPVAHPHCNDYPGADINRQFNSTATSPSLLAANGKLYASWLEKPNSAPYAFNIRAAVLDASVSPDWHLIDGGGVTGLNYNVTRDAEQNTPVQMAWFNNKLYLGWNETNVRVELRAKEYNPAGGTWAFVDGGVATGLNYDPPSPIDPINRDVRSPNMASFNGSLYAIWSENTYNDPMWGPSGELRYKKFNGSVWSSDGSSDGRSLLNYDISNAVDYPAAIEHNKLLYTAWSEAAEVPAGSYNYPMQLRVASFDGTARTMIDGNIFTGLNGTTTNSVYQPKVATFNGDLYAVWRESTDWPLNQNWIRVKKLPLPPYVTSVSVPSNGVYKSGDSLDFTVTFNKSVTVTGSPYLPITLDTGGTVNAAYVSGSGSTSLLFRYTVAGGVADPNGISVGAALLANGGTLRDADADAADLTLNSVAPTAAILVDGIAPTAAITYSLTGPYKAGDTITITAIFSEVIAVSPVPRIAISGANTLAATEMTRDSATQYSYSHLIGAGNGSASVVLSSGTDLAGNPLIPVPASGASFFVIPIPTLTITISGSGSVNSKNGSGTNYACNSSSCVPVIFGYNDTVTLTATGSNSSFSAWSGAINGNANPYTSLLMDGDKAVTATFTPDPAKVLIDGSGIPYYSIGVALGACGQDGAVRAQASPLFAENVVMTTNHILKLRGGFTDAGFTDVNQAGYSTISGSLKVLAGRLTAERVKVRP